MNPYDVAALFWYIRNYFFFHLKLHKRDDIMMCKYEDFVKLPSKFIRKIYSRFDIHYPGDHLTDEVHGKATIRGRCIVVTPKIENLCDMR